MAAPEKRDRRRPLEFLGLALVLAVFIFVVVFMGTREPILGLEFAGIGFIVALVVVAMLSLAARPTGEERADLDEQNRNEGTPPPPRGH